MQMLLTLNLESISLVVQAQLVLLIALESLVFLFLVLKTDLIQIVLDIEPEMFGLQPKHILFTLLLKGLKVLNLVLFSQQDTFTPHIDVFYSADYFVLDFFSLFNMVLNHFLFLCF